MWLLLLCTLKYFFEACQAYGLCLQVLQSGPDDLEPLREMHVDSLFPAHLTLLSKPLRLMSFDFQSGESTPQAHVEVRYNLVPCY